MTVTAVERYNPAQNTESFHAFPLHLCILSTSVEIDFTNTLTASSTVYLFILVAEDFSFRLEATFNTELWPRPYHIPRARNSGGSIS